MGAFPRSQPDTDSSTVPGGSQAARSEAAGGAGVMVKSGVIIRPGVMVKSGVMLRPGVRLTKEV